jgi:hypothetical protein
MDAFIKQGYGGSRTDEVLDRFLELLYQARLVWGQGTELVVVREQ